MNAFVFVGPTLPREQIPGKGAFVCLPPAAQGDVYRAAQTQPVAIGIIDGYFEGVPSVWHKEILWAMSQGVHVYGSASMGALRAAELHAFGMEGVGRIFEAYRDGSFEDDDDVAVLHGPAEVGYAAVSEPMVNIRFTLEQAERDGIIGAETRKRLDDLAKQLFYQERSWEALLKSAGPALPEAELDRFRRWLPRGRIDQKQIDALAMLDAMRKRLAAAGEPKRTSYTFQWTELWDKAMSLAGAVTSAAAPDGIFCTSDCWTSCGSTRPSSSGRTNRRSFGFWRSASPNGFASRRLGKRSPRLASGSGPSGGCSPAGISIGGSRKTTWIRLLSSAPWKRRRGSKAWRSWPGLQSTGIG